MNWTEKWRKYLNPLRECHKWILSNRDERKIRKESPRRTSKLFENELCSRNPIKGRDSWAVCFFWTILYVNKGETRTNKQMDKEINNNAQCLTSKRWNRRIICVKKGIEIELSGVDISTQGLEKFIKKSWERLFATGSKRNRKIRNNQYKIKN